MKKVRTNIKNHIFLIIIFVLMVFIQVIAFDFLKYDDTINILKNRFFHPISASHAIQLWSHPFFRMYIPVTYSLWMGIGFLSKMIYHGRLDAGLFHLSNLLLHILNTLLVYLLLRKLLESKAEYLKKDVIPTASFFGALVFGMHPVQVEAVSWISCFRDLCSAFFSLTSILLFIRFRSQDGTKSKLIWYGAAFSSFLLSVLSKPSAVIVPCVIVMLMLFIDFDFKIFLKNITGLVPWFIVSALLTCVAMYVQPVSQASISTPFLYRPVIAADAVLFYLKKIAWPFELCIDYGRTPGFVMKNSWPFGSFAMLAGLFAALCFFKYKKELYLLSVLFLTGLLPVLGLIPFSHQSISTVADRYLYLPMISVSLSLASIICIKYSKKLVLCLFLLMSAYGILSFQQCKVWKNTGTVMSHTLAYRPQSFLANLNYGIFLASRNRFKQAIHHYEIAQKIKPKNPLSYYNMAIAYACVNDFKSAQETYEKLARINQHMSEKLKNTLKSIKRIKKSRHFP